MLSLSAWPAGQARRAYWISADAGPNRPSILAQSFADVVRGVLSVPYQLQTVSVDPAGAEVETIERKIRSLSPQDLAFVSLDERTLNDLLRRDPSIFAASGLEPMNIGVSAAPFYLFAQAGMADEIRTQFGAQRRIAYVDRIGALQPADVEHLVEPLLRTTAVVVGPVGSPRDLARRLLERNADLVGIYDDEPSPFRNDFLAAYEEMRPKGEAARLQTLKMVVLPAADPDYRDGLRLAQSDLIYAIVRYEDVAFNDATTIVPADTSDGIVAIARNRSPRADDAAAMVLLSNLKRLASDSEYQRVRRLVSHAHLAALVRADIAPTRCAGGSRTAYRAFLFAAHQGDRTDVVKSMALWSDLVLTLASAKKLEEPQLKDQMKLVEDMLAASQRLHVYNHAEWDQLAVCLARGATSGQQFSACFSTTAVPSVAASTSASVEATLRQQFSSQHSTLFGQALEQIRSAFSTAGPARQRVLQRARVSLVELIRKGLRPACIISGSEGRNMREYDPFFYLGLIDAYLAIEPA